MFRNVFPKKTLQTFWMAVSYENLVRYLYQPRDPASLGVIRFFFGLLMLIDLAEERGGSELDKRWGNPDTCHFPLFTFFTIPSFSFICLLYLAMVIGSLGIMLGCQFRFSIFLFGIPYWYILLLDKSFWNNHSYLFGLVTVLLMGSSANHFFSIDGLLNKTKSNAHVPYWNYFILKYQFFMLYFLAGLKKTDTEWLEGYSMRNLGHHWVFIPFKAILTIDQIDYLVVHWFGFLLDLTIGFWMLVDYTRPLAMIFCAMFHLMNSRLFRIGMFPYVCLATMPLFCKENWPRKLMLKSYPEDKVNPSSSCIYSVDHDHAGTIKCRSGIVIEKNVKFKHKFVVALLLCHCGLQVFLPYSHFITKGFNNWTNGLYGYSWDMMVHSWDTILVVVKVIDNESGESFFIDSDAWTLNDRWSKHADMCVQYAECINRNFMKNNKKLQQKAHNDKTAKLALANNQITSTNLSIYVDVWCSLNKRFKQRIFNPNYDLLTAEWSAFKPVGWLLPLLSEYNDFRSKINEISSHVYTWSNNSEVLFVADFPGLYLENFINTDITNVSLTVLDGEVFYEVEDVDTLQSFGIKLKAYERVQVDIGVFHKVHTISETPSCYIYTYSSEKTSMDDDMVFKNIKYSPFPLFEDAETRLSNFVKMFADINDGLLN